MSRRSRSIASSSVPSSFEREIQIPGKTIGLVIGKRGTNVKNFHQIPGITSVTVAPNGIVKIRANSEEAIHTVAFSIEKLVSSSLSKNSSHFPDFFVFCFCKSLEDPLLAINSVCFEKFYPEKDPDQKHISLFCVQSGADVPCQDSMCGSGIDSLSAEFPNKISMSEVNFCSHWGFSAYEAKFMSCLETLLWRQKETMRSVKLIVRFGKQVFYGSNSSDLRHGGFMTVERLQDLCKRGLLEHRLFPACSEAAIEELRIHFQTLGYHKILSRRKITVHVTSLQPRQLLQLHVSVRFDSSNGEDKVVITRVRSQLKKHGFVTFCREGQATADFRLEAVTQGPEVVTLPETVVEWIEKAWRNRTPDQVLVLDPPDKFQVMDIRYKEAETYKSEEWKLRLVRVSLRDLYRKEKVSKRWECGLSSRWFQSKGDGVADDMQSTKENVDALVKEAAALTQRMDSMPKSH